MLSNEGTYSGNHTVIRNPKDFQTRRFAVPLPFYIFAPSEGGVPWGEPKNQNQRTQEPENLYNVFYS
jgi:hypothetical protein